MSAKKKEAMLTHLWRAKLAMGSHSDHFYFRAPDDLGDPSQLAADLADSSPFIQMRAARIVQIECVARLLN